MAFFDTVADYIVEARRLLQDGTAPFRYADATLIAGLNQAIQEAHRVRADLFLPNPLVIPNMVASGDSMAWLDAGYRQAFLYYVVGHAEAFDAEPSQDARASAFINGFMTRLTGSVMPITQMGAPQ